MMRWTILVGLIALLLVGPMGSRTALTQGPLAWDARLDGLRVSLQRAPDSACTEGCWRLIEARYEDDQQSGGMHHVLAQLAPVERLLLAPRRLTHRSRLQDNVRHRAPTRACAGDTI